MTRKRGLSELDIQVGASAPGAGAGSAIGSMGVGGALGPGIVGVGPGHGAGMPPLARRKPTMRDVGTGKRVEKGRRIELQRAIRTKMRLAMNIGPEDALPAPSALTAPDLQPEGSLYWVPNWPAGVSDGQNSQVSASMEMTPLRGRWSLRRHHVCAPEEPSLGQSTRDGAGAVTRTGDSPAEHAS